jgi:outer membrane receptor protein involved in Fe transport
VNDVIFGTFPIPPNFPADELDRVEVLRGPGSVKYGDSAQLAVIRIYTRDQGEGAHASLTGASESGARTGVITFTDRLAFKTGSLGLAGSVNRGRWGSGTWIDNQGTLVDVSTLGTHGANLAADLDASGTKAQFFYNDYRTDGVQNFGTYTPSVTSHFYQASLALSREVAVTQHWSVRPRVSYRRESAWQDVASAYDIPGQRLDATLDATNRYAPEASLSFGIYRQVLMARSVASVYTPGLYYPKDGGWVKYSGTAVYGNWDVKVADFNLSLGARASEHQYSGSSITPRLGLTRATDTWHFKGLFGKATRDPNLEQINPQLHPYQDELRTEHTTVSEVEFGHILGKQHYLTLSLFDQTIRDPIIYLPRPGGFSNNVPVKSRGAELQYWYRGDSLVLHGNASHSRTNNETGPRLYHVQGGSGQFLGAASRIANAWLEWRTPAPGLSVLLDARHLGSRTAFAYAPALGSLTQQVLAPETTFNAALRYRVGRMTMSGGVRNLGNEKQVIPQPYDASVPGTPGSTPFPVGGRELWVRVEWGSR